MDWRVNEASGDLELSGWLEIANPHQRMEIFVPELEVKPVLIGSSDLSDIVISSTVTPHHPDEETRPDGYWPAYIVKGHKRTSVQVNVSLSDRNGGDVSSRVDTVWMEVHWVNYGPFGRLSRREGVVVPLRRPAVLQQETATFRSGDGCSVLPLKPICSDRSTTPSTCCVTTPATWCNPETSSPSVKRRSQ